MLLLSSEDLPNGLEILSRDIAFLEQYSTVKMVLDYVLFKLE